MIKMIKYLVILCYILLGCNTSISESKSIKFELVKKIEIKEDYHYPSFLIRTKKKFIDVFNNEYTDLKEYLDYFNYEKLDFYKYDYIIVFKNEIRDIKTSNDKCEYLNKIPLKVEYNSKKENKYYLSVYKIYDKNMYRNLCP